MKALGSVDVIDSFEGRYRFLSNFYAQPFQWDGNVALTAEHHYNAAKTLDQDERKHVYATDSPGRAKLAGRRVTLRADWDRIERYRAMESVLRAKFADPVLRQRLLATGDALLIEGNNWHDQVWGDCTCPKHSKWPGRNSLGQMLMSLRSEFREDAPSKFVRVSLTGHRPSEFTRDQQEWVRTTLTSVARHLSSNNGTVVAISGMALGADTWWAEAALGEGLRLWSYLPFTDQPARWDASDRQRWEMLRTQASREVCLGSSYDVRLLHCRNELMIRDSDMMIAVHLKEKRSGGTVETIRKARDRGKPMLRLNVSDREVTRVAASENPDLGRAA